MFLGHKRVLYGFSQRSYGWSVCSHDPTTHLHAHAHLLTLMSHNPCHEISSLDIFNPYSPIYSPFLRQIYSSKLANPAQQQGWRLVSRPPRMKQRPIPVSAPPISLRSREIHSTSSELLSSTSTTYSTCVLVLYTADILLEF